MKRLVPVLWIVAFFIVTALSSAQQSCFDCHGEKEFTRTIESGKEESLFVDQEQLANSVHGGFECTDCHTDAYGDPHPDKLAKVDCGTCHDDATAAHLKGIHGQLLLKNDPDAPTCASCHSSHNILPSSDKNSLVSVFNQPHTCGVCHQDQGVAALRGIPISNLIESFEKSVHGKALLAGNENSATCTSCHESHQLRPLNDPESPIFRLNISKTCGQCHDSLSVIYDSSIHGTALARGVLDSPTCNSCHGEHNIASPSDPNSPTSGFNLAEETCYPCHGLAKLNEKYGILPDVVSSYLDSYHGLASSGGSKVAANCSSCHGIHDIYAQSDPRSTIHPGNLTQTCGSCHANATEAFSRSYVHYSADSPEDRISSVVKSIYLYLIIGVIGGMVLHNFIIYLKYLRIKIRALKKRKTIERFDKAWIVQHILLIISFFTLVITGFALKFSNSWWSQALTNMGFSESIRGITHRVAAVVMMLVSVYHLYYLAFHRHGKKEIPELLPKLSDVTQFIQNMKYYLGLSKEKPRFNRYGYVEKAEYWALVWGTLVMAVTGIVLWFPTLATAIFPSWIIKVSETIHYYEAWLATLAILLYHFFFTIFHPEEYPLNLAAFTGKITEESAEEHFAGWYEKIKQEEQPEQPEKA